MAGVSQAVGPQRIDHHEQDVGGRLRGIAAKSQTKENTKHR